MSYENLKTTLRNMTTDELLNYASSRAADSDTLVEALTERLYETRNTLTMVDHTLGELGVDMEEFINTDWKPLETIDG